MKNEPKKTDNNDSVLYQIMDYNVTFPVEVFTGDLLDFKPHFHNEIEIIYVTEPGICIYVNQSFYEMEKGDILFINSNTIHYIESLKQNKTMVLIINAEIFKEIIPDLAEKKINISLINQKSVSNETYRVTEKIIQEIYLEYYNDKEFAKQSILHLLNYLVITLMREIGFDKADGTELVSKPHNLQIIDDIFNYVKLNYKNEISLKILDKHFGYSYFYLSHLFKTNTGMTIFNYIQYVRIYKVKEQLETTEKDVEDIAYECGFGSLKTFYRVFKSINKMAPRDYRNFYLKNKQNLAKEFNEVKMGNRGFPEIARTVSGNYLHENLLTKVDNISGDPSSNAGGVPLGGIGAGKVEFCPNGSFRNLTIHNNHESPVPDARIVGSEGIRGSFFAVYSEDSGAMVLKEKDDDYLNCIKEGEIQYSGKYPFIECKYPKLGDLRFQLEAFSPLSMEPGEGKQFKNASLPCSTFTLTLSNEGKKTIKASALFSWFNIIGKGGYPYTSVEDSRGNLIDLEKDNDYLRLFYWHDHEKIDERLNGNYSVTVKNNAKTNISYLIGLWNSANWDFYSKNGDLPNHEDCNGYAACNAQLPCTGAISLSAFLEPEETMEFTFVLSWFFPDFKSNRNNGEIYKNMYSTWFQSSREVASYVFDNYMKLKTETSIRNKSIEDSNLPVWLKDRLINDLYVLSTNSIYLSDGRFSLAESPTCVSGLVGTMDQRMVANGATELYFPELSRSELDIFRKSQIDEKSSIRFGNHWDIRNGTFSLNFDRLGAIFHDIGLDDLDGGWAGEKEWLSLHWPDITSCYILQVYEHIIWSGDAVYLNEVYDSLKKALHFQQSLDQDGDGIAELWGVASCTFDCDPFDFFGHSPYIITLYIASLGAMKHLADFLKDSEYSKKLKKWISNAQSELDKLWDDEKGYYICWRDENYLDWIDEHRKHDKENDDCLISQLAGVWVARMLNLTGLFDYQKAKTALGSIYDNNIKQYGCPIIKGNENDKTFSAWPAHSEAYFSSCAIMFGLPEKGLEASYKNYSLIYQKEKIQWNQPLSWIKEKSDNFERGWFKWYMSSSSSLYVLNAITGINFNFLENELMICPGNELINCTASIGTKNSYLKKVPVFLPKFHGIVSTSNNEIKLEITWMSKKSDCSVKRLVIPHKDTIFKLKLNNAVINYKIDRIIDDKLLLSVDLQLKKGDKIRIIK